ncbi:YqeG family HAD IIIA-type phosphatase [Carnobacteriaceae bacterium zg-84]|uniref:YqeG family HAD IIIA-type phosphatase n=1 Tax=Granulicatella sp. zg-84 TaxID=2678503 RepID=UPI0013C206E6|nr:YqeG family HAD IIIA-type phosphatase [Granulicatella sp. zg-84]NEW65396.1 YqeG family HAD IIIA-type phosphatase [Granulicatella sp. zg-84]NEW66863.1 YqeG family HAD IIIA-type phosphatase [Granulicatella sp. zg-84]QMI85090.1 YqeG family HAD IIIA-type phosphatase [Carnobacteriaceae bacterium zg-84]QMI85108.1 YqeG family HAD IIIA-type phosphatase [Carnobacteriaceae bacterium zg-84]
MTSFKPTWMLNSVYGLTPEALQTHDIHTVLVDLDNTIVAWCDPLGTPALKEWLQTLKEAHIQVAIVSNNRQNRVAKVANTLDIPYVASAKKPLSSGLKKAMENLQSTPDKTIMVGDQLLTDIVAGTLSKMRTVMVKPLVNSDYFMTKINRFFERRILAKWQKKYHLEWRETLD